MDSNSPEAMDEDAVKESQGSREFGCKYCTKKFSSCQALGGHQNAHKLERALSKTKTGGMGKGIPSFGYQGSHHVYPYPYHGGMFPRPRYPELVPTLTRQSPYAPPRFGLGHAYQAWSRFETRDYEAGKNRYLVPGITRFHGGSSPTVTGDSASCVAPPDLLAVTDYISIRNESMKEQRGITELDLTLKL